jgi:hypothetical protein
MGQIFKIRETDRDDRLGVVKKEISSHSGDFAFNSPIVSQKTPKIETDIQKLRINEITRQIDDNVITELETRGTVPFRNSVRREFLTGKFNLTIFNLKFDRVPNDATIRLLAHTLHSSSQSAMMLPAVKTAFLQEEIPNRKTPIYSLRKVQDYIKMMELIIQENKIGNGKELIGTIPLIPPKFVRPIIELYLSEGIKAFAIDANFKDIILNEGDFRLILSEINKEQPLNEALIFACNVGIPHFERHAIRSDDFLTIFAYIDVLGCAFKPRGGKGIPRAKVFSRDQYAYDVSTYPLVSRALRRAMNYVSLRNYNRSEQLKETLKVRNLLGMTKMKEYLQTKGAVDPTSMKHLESIASNVKIV